MREGISIVIFILVVTAAVAIAGCTTGQGPPTPQPETTPAPQASLHETPHQTEPTGSPTFPQTTFPRPEVTIDLYARNFAFNQRLLTVPAGAQVTINFDNRDNGIPHNFALYTDSSADEIIYRGEIITGPHTITYHFVAPEEKGTYYYQCDLHANTMNGYFVVI